MPSMIVSPVSADTCVRKVGSSRASRASASFSLSRSAFVFGSIRIDMTGSGKCIASSTIGALRSQSVSPVAVSLSPTSATMSPATARSTGSRSFACMRSRRMARSCLERRGFHSPCPCSSVPE